MKLIAYYILYYHLLETLIFLFHLIARSVLHNLSFKLEIFTNYIYILPIYSLYELY
jgi:hypothetical protein